MRYPTTAFSLQGLLLIYLQLMLPAINSYSVGHFFISKNNQPLFFIIYDFPRAKIELINNQSYPHQARQDSKPYDFESFERVLTKP